MQYSSEELSRDRKGAFASWKRPVGYALLIISTITWCGGLFVVPFLSISAKSKLAWGGALVGIGEITFYGAIPFLGREIVRAFRSWMSPFRRLKKWLRTKKAAPEGD